MSDDTDLFAEWRDEARCRTVIKLKPYMDGAWDGPNEEGVEHPYAEDARRECFRCPVRLKCLQDALADPEAQGIRGGYTFDNGKLPVGKAREIVETLDLVTGPHQKMGRPKKVVKHRPKRLKNRGPSKYV